MTTRTEQIVDHVLQTFPLPYPPAIQSQRDALEAEIRRDQITLEALRVKETGLRAELVRELKHLHFNIEVAAHRIETRQWADGCAALDMDFERVNEAQSALLDCLDDIRNAEWQIEDAANTLADSQLWENN